MLEAENCVKMFIIYATARSGENGEFAGFYSNLPALAKI